MRWHVFHNDRARRNDAMVSNLDAWHNDRTRTDEAIIANSRFQHSSVNEVMGENSCVECQGRVLSDNHARGIRLVDLR